MTEVVDMPASVTAKAVATLTAPADGVIAKLAVAPGDTVSAGTVVAVIDSPSARKRLADAKAALAAANSGGGSTLGAGSSDLTEVQIGLDRAASDAFADARKAADQVADETLRQALRSHIDAAQASYEAAAKTSRELAQQVHRGLADVGAALSALRAAQRAQAKSAYDVAKATVDSLTLRAPISGVVQFAHRGGSGSSSALEDLLGTLAVPGGMPAGMPLGMPAGDGEAVGVDDTLAVGDHVGAGTPIVTIVDVSEIGLVGEVDETDVLLVSPGVVADVELDAAPGFSYRATVRTVDLLPTTLARGGVAYRVRLAFLPAEETDADESPPTPRPGMSAVAHLRVRTATDAVVVPATAVFRGPDGDMVWLVTDGVATAQPVKVGVQGQDLVEVVSGLVPGQRVVVRGTDKVSAGQRLR